MLIGRESELSELGRLVDATQPVVVLGEAGVGKTTLVRAVGAASARPLVEAGALSTLSWLPYLPFRRVLGREPVGDPAYLATEVERKTGDGILLLDDVHWADRETRAVLPFLAGRLRLVATVRRGDAGAGAALEELGAAGFTLLPLEPLGAQEAAELVHRLRPGSSRDAVRALVERTGGNPLLIEELAASGEPTESLQLALAARLRVLSDAGREAMGLLALAGRPVDAVVLGSGGQELVTAGLAVAEGDVLVARHALLAEAAASGLSGEERRALHLRLAEELEDPGERARHCASAGLRERAFAEAMQAVEAAATPGERAAHLELAAICAEGPEADRLRLAAAEALAEADLVEQAVRLLDEIGSGEAPIVARRQLYESRVWLARWDAERARTECEAGLALVAGSGSEIEARLALHDAQMAQARAVNFDLDASIAWDKARHALELAQGSAELEAPARCLLGSVGLLTQEPGWRDEYRRALELARDRGTSDTEFQVAGSFGFALLISGELDEALEVNRVSGKHARERRLTVWERRLRSNLSGLYWHAGELRSALEECETLAAEAGPHEGPGFYRAQVLADLGRHDEAIVLARGLVDRALPTWQSLGAALWALCDAELAAGNPRGALDAADDLLRRFGDRGPTAFVQLTRGWARHDLGLLLDRPDLDAGQPMVEGAPHELRGLALLGEGRAAEAAACFADAAALWEGRHFRGSLRCLWAAGEALRLAGDATAAIAALERAEAVAADHGEAPTSRRIRRSLRLAGVRRSAVRGVEGALTHREREVLGLVGQGISNGQIARRLGVGVPTVERLLQSASRKLGARTRAQAAALADRA